MRPQTTIRKPVTVQGPGLFTGEAAKLTLRPAPAGSGIRFVREFEGARSEIPARIEHVAPAQRRTSLRNGTLSVETVEHCLAACAGLGLSNAELELTNTSTGELPMGDGSCTAFVEAIEEAGLEEQPGDVRPLVVKEPVVVQLGEASLAALPGPVDHMEIVYTFEAPPPVGRQVFTFHLHDSSAADDFRRDLAPARTFIFESDVPVLHSKGMGRHLTYADLVVIGDAGPIENAFRFPDECVRHKVLDLIGDLSLVGRPIFGRIVAHKSGHELNHMLARRLLEVETAGALARLPNENEAPVPPQTPGFQRLAAQPVSEAALDIRKIQRILPHRFPMLLVDRVLRIEGDQRAIGLKNVTMGDMFFLGHYPTAPIFPGVLIVEAMAQLGGILLSRKLDNTGKLAVLLSMDNVKMRQPVVPGDQLILEAEAVRVKSRTGHVRCSAYVCDRLAAEADIKFMLVDAETE